MTVRLPNFLIVGAAKTGSTSLYHYLNQHPDVYMPAIVEPRFFSNMPKNFKGPGDDRLNAAIICDLTEYENLFADVKDEKAIGEKSPDYLYYYTNSIANIKNILGDDVKIIIVLRNPIDRAFSQYLHYKREHLETESFEKALELETKRKELNWAWSWFYKDVGFHYEQVKSYVKSFKKIRIFLFENFQNRPKDFIHDIFEFLEVDSEFNPTMDIKHNVAGIVKEGVFYQLLHRLLNTRYNSKATIKKFLNSMISSQKINQMKYEINRLLHKKPSMRFETREYLRDLYRDDIMGLQHLINRDLSHWLS